MNFYPAIWNVLHDGGIIAIQGAVPGTVRLDVAVAYLRERFSDPGDTIQVTLTGCTRFAYREFEIGEFTTDLSAIAAMEPELLSAKMLGNLCEVVCVAGVLEVIAVEGSLALDSGRSITLQELIDVSKAYWTEFSQRAKQAKRESP